ncbi:hypothetical protein RM190_04875 [Paracoccus sp. CPCC 101403]|uniref:Helix-turn-helix domain-containing protein n=1 Tax=Paracoccus broussonetiae TaxID=3075834 RepID=A0ABU3EAD4_9RHOB|nr:hypothetical protein [Paracoccus sp. CPCC 101403]MDT1061182.1 hypothetical protein [Paracoccus sp. CPCC 101403]
MTLYDPDDSRHDAITPQERAAISAWLASNQPTICPPRTHAKPEWEMQPIVSAETSNRYMRARKTRVLMASAKRKTDDSKSIDQRITAMREAGLSISAVAAALGLSKTAVDKRIRRMDGRPTRQGRSA